MSNPLNNLWRDLLAAEFEKAYYQELRNYLANEYRSCTIYPDMFDIFNALHYTDYPNVKVVILGQDPYHGPGQAHGLSFSVQHGVKAPPSLVNIFKEMHKDLACPIPQHGCLEAWAKAGVLLLNTVLTVRAGQAASHKAIGWEHFTDAVIKALNDSPRPLVFILWGAHAQSKRTLINNNSHLIIESAHPSPFSANRGFFGSKPFSRANQFLAKNKITPIDWCIKSEVS